MPAEDSLLAAIAHSPEDVAAWLVYADWLEENGDPRAAYLRLRCDLLQATVDGDRRELQRRARALTRRIKLDWLRFIALQEILGQVSRRCGAPLPAALGALWREAVWQTDPRKPPGGYPLIDTGGTWQEVLLAPDGRVGQDVYPKKNPDRREAFLAMFRQIDFLGLHNDRGDSFGFWRYAADVKPVNAPVISLDIGCQFCLGGRTLQDFLAVPDHSRLGRVGDPRVQDWGPDERDEFAAAHRWFAERGIDTSPSLEAAALAIKALPDPQERFNRYCRGDMVGFTG